MYQLTPQDIEKYLAQKGFDYRKIGNQYALNGCPVCKDEKPNHFYINDEGLWHCMKCGGKGNFYQLKKELGDIRENYGFKKPYNNQYQKPVQPAIPVKPKVIAPKIVFDRAEIDKYFEKMYMENVPLVEYFIKQRGFSEKTIDKFKLGWDGQCVTIPIFEKGRIVNIRRRRSPINENEKLPKYFSVTGTEVGMFNTDSIKADSKPVFITEGEMDAIALTNQDESVQVVSGTGGATSFKKEWAGKYFKGKRRIYICYDSDQPGQDGAEKVAEILGPHRCRILELPQGVKDINEFFIKGFKIADFNKLLGTARKPKAQSTEIIELISGVLGRIKEQMDSGGDLFSGLNTGYAGIDAILQRMRPGDLIILSGLTSMGKTFFAQNIIHKLARNGVSVMFFSLEMTPEQASERFIMIDSGINSDKFSGGILSLDSLELVEVENSITKLSSLPIYFYNGEGDINKDKLEEISKIAVDQFGCQLIVVDHLHYFAESPDDTKQVSEIVRKAKVIARDNEIPLIMISHVRKLENEGKTPSISDLRNSSLIGQDADIVMMVHREKPDDQNDIEAGKTVVHILKNRHGKRGQVCLNMDFASCRFYELDKDHDDYNGPTENPKPTEQGKMDFVKKIPDPTRKGYKED